MVDVAGAGTSNGTNVQQYEANETTAQDWLIVSVGEGEYSLISRVSGLYMDVAGGSAENGANIWTWKGNVTASQIFTFTPVAEPIEMTFISAVADGEAETTTSTKITMVFNQDIEGFTVEDITLKEGVQKGDLTKTSSATYELTISGEWEDGDQTNVTLAKTGYTFTPPLQWVTLHKEAGRETTPITFSSAAADGDVETTSTWIIINLSEVVEGFSVEDITLSNENVTKGVLSLEEGSTYKLTITGNWAHEDKTNVILAKEGYTFTPDSREVTLNKNE